MANYVKYLLYTEADISGFRTKYATQIAKNSEKYTKWVNSLPAGKWCSFVREGASEKEAQFLVGLLCILYIDRKIIISFSDHTAAQIRREPGLFEETTN